MPTMNPMDAVVRVLEDEGVRVAFGIPGAAILPLYAALERSSIRHLSVRHEEGGTHAADGWARVTGEPGICIGTSGPAGTNMITGLYTALADSIPIICITGQAPTAVLHKEAFQAVDIVAIAKPVTKWAVQVKEAAQLTWIFRAAFQVARSGRPGPVLIDLPLDVQRAGPIPYDSATDARLPVSTNEPPAAAIARVIEMLGAAERPLILAGGGIIIANASQALVRLAERVDVPVTPTLMGKGAIREDHPLWAGTVGIQTSQPFANQLFLESDLVIAVGARFGDRHTGALDVYRGDRAFVHIDIAAEQIGRVFPPELGIVADARLALEALYAEAERRGAPRTRPAWVGRLAELRVTRSRECRYDEVPIRAPRVYHELNQLLPEDATVVTAIGLYQIFSGQFQTAYRPRHYLCCGQAGPLGWEVSACTGAKLARPASLVVGIVGDYSFQFLMEEVAVAVQYGVPFVLVMLNNGYMGLIRQAEVPYDMNYEVDLAFGGPAGDAGIDHVMLMRAMGADGVRVTEPDGLRKSVEWAIAESDRRRIPVLVEVMTSREESAAMGSAIDAIREPHEIEVVRSAIDGEAERGSACLNRSRERTAL
jgi:tartronate-semialdehyde synthase